MPRPKQIYDELMSASGDEVLRVSRKILSHGNVQHWVWVFQAYQQRCPDRRWGLENCMEVMLGPLRIKALYILQDPACHEHMEIAMFMLNEASKPKDIPLVLRCLLSGEVSVETIRAACCILQTHVEQIKEEHLEMFLEVCDHLIQRDLPLWMMQTLALICDEVNDPSCLVRALSIFEQMPIDGAQSFGVWVSIVQSSASGIDVLEARLEGDASCLSEHDQERYEALIMWERASRAVWQRNHQQWLALLDGVEEALASGQVDVAWWMEQLEPFDNISDEQNFGVTADRVMAMYPLLKEELASIHVWLQLVKILELRRVPECVTTTVWRVLSARHAQSLRLLALNIISSYFGESVCEDTFKRLWCAARESQDVRFVEGALRVLDSGYNDCERMWPIYLEFLQHPSPELQRVTAVYMEDFFDVGEVTPEHQWQLQYIHDRLTDPHAVAALRAVLRSIHRLLR